MRQAAWHPRGRMGLLTSWKCEESGERAILTRLSWGVDQALLYRRCIGEKELSNKLFGSNLIHYVCTLQHLLPRQCPQLQG